MLVVIIVKGSFVFGGNDLRQGGDHHAGERTERELAVDICASFSTELYVWYKLTHFSLIFLRIHRESFFRQSADFELFPLNAPTLSIGYNHVTLRMLYIEGMLRRQRGSFLLSLFNSSLHLACVCMFVQYGSMEELKSLCVCFPFNVFPKGKTLLIYFSRAFTHVGTHLFFSSYLYILKLTFFGEGPVVFEKLIYHDNERWGILSLIIHEKGLKFFFPRGPSNLTARYSFDSQIFFRRSL